MARVTPRAAAHDMLELFSDRHDRGALDHGIRRANRYWYDLSTSWTMRPLPPHRSRLRRCSGSVRSPGTESWSRPRSAFLCFSCRSRRITHSRSPTRSARMALAGGGILEVVITGDRPDLLGCVRSRYEPDAVVAWGERTSSPVWEEGKDGAAYLCHRNTCLVPARTVEELSDQLDGELGGKRPLASAGSLIGASPRVSPDGSTFETPIEGKVSR